MRHYLPLENRSSELRRLSAKRSNGTSRRRRSAPAMRKTSKKSQPLDFNLQYGMPPAASVELPQKNKVDLLEEKVEDLAKRIGEVENAHSSIMKDHDAIKKEHKVIMQEHNFIMNKAAEAKAKELLEAFKKSKKGGATRRKRRIYK